MNAIVSDSFAATAAQALERMAFVFTEPGEEGPGEVLARPTISAQVRIEGESALVHLCLSATHDFLVEVASAMLGLEPEDVSVGEYGFSTVSELANVLGGELVMAMGGGDEPLRLSLPDLATEEEAGELADSAVGTKDGGSLVLQTDTGGCLLMTWCPE